MEKTLTIYVASRNEQWELPDNLAMKWSGYETDHPLAGDGHNADTLHQDWFDTLTPEEQSQIVRTKPEE